MTKRQTVMISGASSGIGEALAGQFARAGYDLVLVARNEARLLQLAKTLKAEHGVNAAVEAFDLAKRSAARTLSNRMTQQSIEIDILVNNAGVLEYGNFVDINHTDHQRIIDLNILGLTSLLDYFLPPMIERQRGKVLNVASIAAFQPVPSLATYAASKAYVLSLTESLSEELKGTGVSITALCPGITDTNMVSSAQEKSEGLTIPRFAIGDVDEVARQGYKACIKGDVLCIPGAVNQVVTLAGRTTPKWLLRRVSGIIGRYNSRN